MADDDDVRLPRPPPPLTPPEPRVHPPMPPAFAPERERPLLPTIDPGTLAFEMPPPPPNARPFALPLPPDFEPRRVETPELPAMGMGFVERPPSPRWIRATVLMIAAFLVLAAGLAGYLLLRPTPRELHVNVGEKFRAVSVPEQTIELPPGQHLVSVEIGPDGQAYYQYTPLQPGEQPKNSTVEGRYSNGYPIGKIHFIERAAE